MSNSFYDYEDELVEYTNDDDIVSINDIGEDKEETFVEELTRLSAEDKRTEDGSIVIDEPYSAEEVAVKNVFVGGNDYLDVVGLSIGTVDEWEAKIEEFEKINPSTFQSIAADAPKYISDVAAIMTGLGIAKTTKVGASIVKTTSKLLRSENAKVRILTAAALAELETKTSAEIHDDDYVPLVGAVVGGTIAKFVKPIKQLENKLEEINNLNEWEKANKEILDSTKEKIDEYKKSKEARMADEASSTPEDKAKATLREMEDKDIPFDNVKPKDTSNIKESSPYKPDEIVNEDYDFAEELRMREAEEYSKKDIEFNQKIKDKSIEDKITSIKKEISDTEKLIKKDKQDNPELFQYSIDKDPIDEKTWNKLGIAYRKTVKGTATKDDYNFVNRYPELVDSEVERLIRKTDFEPNVNVDRFEVDNMELRIKDLNDELSNLTKPKEKAKPKQTTIDLGSLPKIGSKGKEYIDLGKSVHIVDSNTNIKEVVNQIVKNTEPNDIVNQIADIASLDKNKPFMIKTTDKIDYSDDAVGLYTKDKDFEGIDIKQTVESKDKALRTIGHEIVHKVSAKYMDNNTKFQVKSIMNHPRVKQYIKGKEQYAKHSEAEFIADGIIGDDKLVKILKSTTKGDTSLYARLKSAVKKLFGKPNKNTLYDDLDNILRNMDRTKEVDISDSLTKIETSGMLKKAAKAGDKILGEKSSKYKGFKEGLANLTFVKQTKIDWGIGFKNIQKQLSNIATYVSNVEHRAVEIDNVIKTEFDKYFKGYNKEFKQDIGRAIVNTDLTRTIKDNPKAMKRFEDILEDRVSIDKTIGWLSKDIDKSKVKRIEETAMFGVKGVAESLDVHTNIKQLAKDIEVDEDLVREIATLKALKINGTDNLKKLYKENKKAFMFSLESDHFNRVESSKKLFEGQEHREMFGYSRDRFTSKNEFIVVNKDDAPEFTYEKSKLGWNYGKDVGSKRVLLYRKDLSEEFRHGLIPPQKQAVSGDLIFEPIVAMNMDEQTMKNVLLADGVVPNQVIPVRNKDGKIVNYRAMMDKEWRKKILGLDDSIDVQVSNTAQSIVRKVGAKEINDSIGESLIAKSNDIDLESPSSTFVDSDIFKTMDNDLKKEYKRLTNQELQMLPDKYKKQSHIRKDLADVVIGYKEFFVSDIDNRAGRYTEEIWKGMVSEFKQNILKYPVVLANNLLSNNGILVMSGLNPKEIVKYQSEALKGIKELRRLEKKKILYEIKRDLNPKKYDNLLKYINKRIDNNPLSEAKRLGFMQSITEEVFIDGMKTDNLFREEVKEFMLKGKDTKLGKIASKLANKKMNSEEGLEKIFNEFYGGEGSYMWKQVTNAMQYGDYMARWALYKKNISRGMSKEEAAEISQKRFVDYRKNLPKIVQTLSDYGFAPFATFAYRIQPELIKMANEDPVKVSGSLLMMHLFGGATEDSVRTDSWNIYGSFMDVGALQANPFSTNMVVPMPHEVIFKGITEGEPLELLKLLGISVR